MKKENHTSDNNERNAELFFSTASFELLVQIMNRTVSARKLAKNELEKRGFNRYGRWIGMDERD